MRVRWSEQARLDLLEIVTFIAAERPAAARALVSRIRGSVVALARSPQLGRIVPEIEMERVRERIVAPYRVLYHVGRDEVVVLTVLHERRDLAELVRGGHES